MRCSAIFAVALALSGCITIGSGTTSSMPRDRPPSPSVIPKGAEERSSRQGTKRVTDKEEPSTLIASDASRCDVGDAQYRATKIGDAVTCEWLAPAGKARPPQ